MVASFNTVFFSRRSGAMVILRHFQMPFYRSLCELSELSGYYMPRQPPHDVLGILAAVSRFRRFVRKSVLRMGMPRRTYQSTVWDTRADKIKI